MPNVASVLRFAFLGAINIQITNIVVESLLFRGCRAWAKQCNPWVGELVSCDLCFGMWVGFVLSLVFRPHFVEAAPGLSGSHSADRVIRSAGTFLGDAFAIALAGRIFNELLGFLSREVALRDEQRELLEEEVRRAEARSAP